LSDDGAEDALERRRELLLVWQVLAQRRISTHAALWQTPALSVTAQAFLMSIALGATSSSTARVLAASVAIVVGIVTMQLVVRHRWLELLDWLELLHLEQQLQLGSEDRLDGILPHGDEGRLNKRGERVDGKTRNGDPLQQVRYHDTTRARAEERAGALGAVGFRWMRQRMALHAWLLAQGAFILVATIVVTLTLVGGGHLLRGA
jgi:hypothetical protein